MSNEQVLKTEKTRVMVPGEVSREFFNGRKSIWAVLQMVRKKQIPNFRIGNRVYFYENSLHEWAKEQMKASMKTEELEIRDGIRRLR